MSVSIDPQAIGWADDGTESGALRTIPNGMVIIPFDAEPATEHTGSTLNAFYTALSGKERSNGSSLSMSLPASAGAYIRRTFTFRGTMLGIYMDTTTGAAVPAYTVMIDGVAYKAGNYPGRRSVPYRLDAPATAIKSSEFVDMIATDLSDTVHEASIVMQSVAANTTALKIYGIGVSRAAGYVEPMPYVWRITSIDLTTTPTTIEASVGALDIKALSKFIFYNNAEIPVIVTVAYGNSPMFVQSIQAKTTIEWVFPTPMAIDKTLYKVSAESASSVTMHLIGRA